MPRRLSPGLTRARGDISIMAQTAASDHTVAGFKGFNLLGMSFDNPSDVVNSTRDVVAFLRFALAGDHISGDVTLDRNAVSGLWMILGNVEQVLGEAAPLISPRPIGEAASAETYPRVEGLDDAETERRDGTPRRARLRRDDTEIKGGDRMARPLVIWGNRHEGR